MVTMRRELTERQLEVVALVVDGLSDQQIADELGITCRTARAHVAQSMRALGVRSRTQLAVRALRAGIVPLHREPPSEEDGSAD